MNDYQSNWHGKLNLTYQYQNNSTQLISSYHQAPLKIQRSFYPEDKQICHSIIIHTAGGIVGGDLLSQNINLGDNCQTLISTPSANKIYKTNGKIAQQTVNIQLAQNSYLEYLPQENIVFNGAEYQQNFLIELGENSHYCGWEINRFGRTARGEKFTQGAWKSSTEIWQNNQPLWIDKQILMGNEIMVNSLNGLAGFAITGTFCWFGNDISEEIIKNIRESAKNQIMEGQTGVTKMMQGLLCRYRGNSTTEVKKWFIEVWGILRINYLKRSKIIPRVWQI